jgi:hypothetical protein
MKPYAKTFTLTDSIIQDGKDLAKNELFGNADDNVKYAKGVKDHLTACYQNPANEQQKALEDVMEESDEDGGEEGKA